MRVVLVVVMRGCALVCFVSLVVAARGADVHDPSFPVVVSVSCSIFASWRDLCHTQRP